MKPLNYWLTSEMSDYRIKSRVQIYRGNIQNINTIPLTNTSIIWRTLYRYTVEWIGREGLDPETHSEYLQHFITHFYRNIVKLVDRAMRKEDSSAQGQIITEILQHLHACNNSVKVRVYKRFNVIDKYQILN